MTAADKASVGAGAVVGLAVVLYLLARSVKAAIPAGTFNPASANNAAYRAASTLTEFLTGIPGDSPGVALHRLFNPGYEAANPAAYVAPFPNSAPYVGDLETVAQNLSEYPPAPGPAGDSLGTWVYGWMNPAMRDWRP